MKKLIILVLMTFAGISHAQDTLMAPIETGLKSIPPVEETKFRAIGAELDALPYLSGGYYASLWYGVDQFRFRGVIASTTVPEFMNCSCIETHRINAGAFIVDYFFKESFEGWWLAAGYEYWDNWVTPKEEQERYFVNHVLTVGGGFVWKFWGGLYLNPWVAGHISISGTEPVAMDGWSYYPKVFVPEVSIKLGYQLDIK